MNKKNRIFCIHKNGRLSVGRRHQRYKGSCYLLTAKQDSDSIWTVFKDPETDFPPECSSQIKVEDCRPYRKKEYWV